MKSVLLVLLFLCCLSVYAQPKRVCTTDPVYRQFDFWIGDWEAYALNGKKAGNSRIELILDSCVIMENWKSANGPYAGKSFNKYNVQTKQWQQTWVDNMGGSTEYLQGHYDNKRMVFLTNPFPYKQDTMAIRRLSFYDLGPDKVRQHGELSKDNGTSWITEYDLEYRRKHN